MRFCAWLREAWEGACSSWMVRSLVLLSRFTYSRTQRHTHFNQLLFFYILISEWSNWMELHHFYISLQLIKLVLFKRIDMLVCKLSHDISYWWRYDFKPVTPTKAFKTQGASKTHRAHCLEGSAKKTSTDLWQDLSYTSCLQLNGRSKGAVPPGGRLPGCRWHRCLWLSSAGWSCLTSFGTAHRPDRTAGSPHWTQNAGMLQTLTRQLGGGGGSL